ncbi:ABC transporter ATP-binding protein [Aquimonas voraii]|uniref:ATP-binding cassette, subfamily B n=1 Tax=Aquimonas voraii TaxID=265719 RepID=A0A1G6S8V9_9GAMM|nr:ABC transporter ATP-binding protein [Aquimonas voraii]SDD13101.1 ATP-binding cassette, subfamily B [Aquimonas voraii]
MHPLRRLLGHARSYRRTASIATVYTVLNKVFDVLPEILIGIAVDVVVNQRESFIARMGLPDPIHQLLLLTALTVLIWGLESLTEYLAMVRWRNLAQSLQHDLRIEAYAHLQGLTPGALADARSGRLSSVLNEDVHQIERFMNAGAHDLIQVFCSTLLVGAVFFALSAPLALLALLPVPLILFGAFWFMRRLQPRYAAAREAAAGISQRLSNNLHGMATIQAYTAEQAELKHLEDASAAYRERNAEAIRVAAAITPVIRIAILAGFVATLLYGGVLTLRGELGVGSYSALVYLTQRLLWPLTRLAELTDLYQRSMTSVRRVFDLLALPQPADRGERQLAGRSEGALRFRDLRFAYGDTEVLHGIDLEVPAGHTVGLVGATGSGKSTLIKLLLRFETPKAGRVELDGIDIEELPRSRLRRQIGHVAQEPFLTDGTVAENIAYGDAAPDPARIEAAARAAEAHGFIAALPKGYDTEVGERGHTLSGGQRQRIALARALYRDPPLLVLDEATSAVDNETEAAIQRSLAKAAQGRSVLVVAHRLSTVRHAHCIHVLDAGRIVESGTHEALLARDGLYAGLWRLQTGEAVQA